jgi:hypothetical protein
MATKTLCSTIVHRMDAFAIQLLEQAKTSESLADKVAAFDRVGKWVAIKNKLEIVDEKNSGTTINDLKRKIDASKPKAGPGPASNKRNGSLARWPNRVLGGADGNGGASLDELKAQLSAGSGGSDDGGVRGAGEPARGKTAAAAGDERNSLLGVLGDVEPFDVGDGFGGLN